MSQTDFNSEREAINALPDWVVENRGDIDVVGVTTPKYHIRWSHLGGIVRKRREASGMSLRSMAKWMSISPTYLSDMERGIRPWNEKRLKDASDVLEMAERTQPKPTPNETAELD